MTDSGKLREVADLLVELGEKGWAGTVDGIADRLEKREGPGDATENCDICSEGDEVDPRVIVCFGRFNIVVHPQCLSAVARKIEEAERE